MSKILNLSLILFIIFIFSYFRLKPLYFQTVGYTYDQGRDFLKVAEIVFEKNPTFIGPTTGIQGLFHGAWWYYLLIIPFLIFKGSPIGYYYFNFFIQIVSFLLFAFFLNKYFGRITTLTISGLTATSPYFIFTSIFVGNNIMVIPIFLFFLIVNYLLLKKTKINKLNLLFLIGLSLGLVAEFELAFGLFLIPSYILTVVVVKALKHFFLKRKGILIFLVGLMIPFIPRLLFELRNSFPQTKILFSQFFLGGTENPNTYAGNIQERLNLFFRYFKSLFSSEILLLIFVIFFAATIILIFEKKIKKYDQSLSAFLILFLFLYFFSVLYKNKFFWGNYYEGLQYLFLFLLAFIFSIELRENNSLFQIFKFILLLSIFFTATKNLYTDFHKKPTDTWSLKSHQEIVNYIQDRQNDNKEYCVKIYTPPVVPFTYRYLFLYNRLSKNIPEPKNEWSNLKCWYILEEDENKERREKWIKSNISRTAKLIESKKVSSASIELWKKQ